MYVPDRCTGSCQPLDVNVLRPVKQRTHNIFRRKQRSSMPSHFRLALKYECFVTAWNGTKRSTIIGACVNQDYSNIYLILSLYKISTILRYPIKT